MDSLGLRFEAKRKQVFFLGIVVTMGSIVGRCGVHYVIVWYLKGFSVGGSGQSWAPGMQ